MEVAFYFDHMEVVRGQFQREILMLLSVAKPTQGECLESHIRLGEIKSRKCDRGMFEKSYQIQSGGNTTILTLFQTRFVGMR